MDDYYGTFRIIGTCLGGGALLEKDGSPIFMIDFNVPEFGRHDTPEAKGIDKKVEDVKIELQPVN